MSKTAKEPTRPLHCNMPESWWRMFERWRGSQYPMPTITEAVEHLTRQAVELLPDEDAAL